MAKALIKKSSGLQQKNVVLSNVLNRSAQGFDLIEKRLLMAAIAKMGGVFGEVKITAAEYADAYEVDHKNSYEQLRKAARSLFRRYIAYEDERFYVTMNWCSKAKYDKGNGFVAIKFNDDLMPHLCELQNKFTQYQLKQTAALRSVYSWRLLELLEQVRQKEGDKKKPDGWLQIGLDDFLTAVDAPPSHRKNFAWVRQKIIDPAIRELTDKDGWKIEREFIKSGRRVSAIRFDFRRNPQGRLDL